MQIVIDISEEDYEKATKHLRAFNKNALKEDFMNATLRDRLEIALLNGTPLTREYDISQVMYAIYMEGVNMTGEYQGCWVRYKDVERIMNEICGRCKK